MPDQGYLPPDTYRVSQLGRELQEFLSEAFAAIWVGGEVQRPRASANGHLYFELVEKGPGDRVMARLDAVIWRRDHQRVRAAMRRHGAAIEEGQSLRCFGAVDFYPAGGRLQLVVREVDPLFTLGALARRRQLLLQELAEAGLLGRNAELTLPEVPLALGLVASRESAGALDFLETLRASGYAFRVWWVDARVQGEHAEQNLAGAIGWLDRRARSGHELDAIVIVRGGGSRTDLAAFDSRRVALAIAGATRPVLTGIGHQVDRSVADEVAHRAFKTPTEAGEFLTRRVTEAERRRLEAERRLGLVARRLLDRADERLRWLGAGLRRSRERVRQDHLRLAERSGAIARLARLRLQEAARSAAALDRRLREAAPARLVRGGDGLRRSAHRLVEVGRAAVRTERQRLGGLGRLLAELGPERTLARGFSVTRDEGGRLLRSADAVEVGARLSTRLLEGVLTSRVEARDAHPTPAHEPSPADPEAPSRSKETDQ